MSVFFLVKIEDLVYNYLTKYDQSLFRGVAIIVDRVNVETNSMLVEIPIETILHL